MTLNSGSTYHVVVLARCVVNVHIVGLWKYN